MSSRGKFRSTSTGCFKEKDGKKRVGKQGGQTGMGKSGRGREMGEGREEKEKGVCWSRVFRLAGALVLQCSRSTHLPQGQRNLPGRDLIESWRCCWRKLPQASCYLLSGALYRLIPYFRVKSNYLNHNPGRWQRRRGSHEMRANVT